MNAMTCTQAQEHLDLLAAGACDEALQTALQEHVHGCPSCGPAFAESQRLAALLDMHWDQAGRQRLHRRIEQEARTHERRRRVAPFLRGLAAAAALLLLAVGAIIFLPRWDHTPAGPQLALLVQAERGPLRLELGLPGREAPPPTTPARGPEALAAHGKVAAVRNELLRAQQDGQPPLPPAVSLDLTLDNRDEHTVDIHLGDAVPTLELDVRGPGVVRMAVPTAPTPAFLQPVTFPLAPGEQRLIRIDRLIAGSRGNLEYIYLTEPGTYTVTAHLQVKANGRNIVVSGQEITIRVAAVQE